MPQQSITIAPNTLPNLPEAYVKLGANRGFAPPDPSSLRFYLTGMEGEGKSTFVMSIPDAIVLDMDAGTYGSVYGKATRIVIRTFSQYQKVRDQLLSDGRAGISPFRKVVFDTGDKLVGFFEADICAKDGDAESIADVGAKGAGYERLKKRIAQEIAAYEAAGYSWVVVAHLQEKTIVLPDGKERTVLRDTLTPKIAALFRREADYVGVIGSVWEEAPVFERKVINGVERQIRVGVSRSLKYVLNLLADGNLQAKRRIPLVTNQLVLPLRDGWQAFCDAYREACMRLQADATPTQPGSSLAAGNQPAACPPRLAAG